MKNSILRRLLLLKLKHIRTIFSKIPRKWLLLNKVYRTHYEERFFMQFLDDAITRSVTQFPQCNALIYSQWRCCFDEVSK